MRTTIRRQATGTIGLGLECSGWFGSWRPCCKYFFSWSSSTFTECTFGRSATMRRERPANKPEQQGTNWMAFAFKMVLSQVAIRYLFGAGMRSAAPPTAPTGAGLSGVPAAGPAYYKNMWQNDEPFDVFVHVSSNPDSTWQELRDGEDEAHLIWVVGNQRYNTDGYQYGMINSSWSFTPSDEAFDALTHNPLYDEELVNMMVETRSERQLKEKAVIPLYSAFAYYAHVTLVSHDIYSSRDSSNPINSKFDDEMLNDGQSLVNRTLRLFEWIEPFSENELQSLVATEQDDETNENIERNAGDRDRLAKLEEMGVDVPKRMPYVHFKRRLDLRAVFDLATHTEANIRATPTLRDHMKLHPASSVYHPIIFPSDFWSMERDYIILNETLKDVPLNLTLTWNRYPVWAFIAQTGLVNPLRRQTAAGTALVGATPPAKDDLKLANNPADMMKSFENMMQMQRRKDQFMFQKMITETKPWVVAALAVYAIAHFAFSILEWKNDIAFWKRNESMEGLSALSVVATFVCTIITGLYIFDSEEASLLLCFNIAVDVAMSGWRITKALDVSVKKSFPFISIKDKAGYGGSQTKKYDEYAIKFMSILLLPLVLGCSVYALFYYKYKSWYSWAVASLARTVYTFGFVMMTPQLYINYKLQSVEHLPWRALGYRTLNTFIDDIFSFVIDMPMLHRVACLRDDVIFFCYLYQRWAYRVDRTRASEWIDPAETERFRREAALLAEEEVPVDATEAEEKDARQAVARGEEEKKEEEEEEDEDSREKERQTTRASDSDAETTDRRKPESTTSPGIQKDNDEDDDVSEDKRDVEELTAKVESPMGVRQRKKPEKE
eukprot:Selendium_serpulae@DN6231_c4_g1_i4.p1